MRRASSGMPGLVSLTLLQGGLPYPGPAAIRIAVRGVRIEERDVRNGFNSVLYRAKTDRIVPRDRSLPIGTSDQPLSTAKYVDRWFLRRHIIENADEIPPLFRIRVVRREDQRRRVLSG